MQGQDYSFDGLRSSLLEKLREQRYSPITTTGYRYQCNSIFRWMKRNGYDHYSVEGASCIIQI